MNMEITFSPGFTTCPRCGFSLVLYKTERRIVKSVDCRFTAVLDRILHHSTVVNTRGESQRLKDKRKNALSTMRKD
jgi:hypothetical protein